jgi:hypothetical protein
MLLGNAVAGGQVHTSVAIGRHSFDGTVLPARNVKVIKRVCAEDVE